MRLKTLAPAVGIILLVNFSFSSCGTALKKKGLEVTKWENFYEGTNIHFYYEDSKNERLEQLKREYNLNEEIGESGDELDRAILISKWENKRFDFDKGSMSTKEDALGILEEKKSQRKASDRDYSIVFSQVAASLGMYARRGEFRVANAQYEDSENHYKVCEIWSEKFNKWIMIDVVKGVYISDGDTPLSAVELLECFEQNKSLTVRSIDNPTKYFNELKIYLNSYTTEIDSSIYGKKRSNSYITYLSGRAKPELRVKDGFIPPTIFVNKKEIFSISPELEYKNDKSDQLPTMILMKKTSLEQKSDSSTFVIGAFKDSVMINNYYIKFNGSEWINVDNYFDITLQKGNNIISLSLDGENAIREIYIQDNR